jgi:hypothetical protein
VTIAPTCFAAIPMAASEMVEELQSLFMVALVREWT